MQAPPGPADAIGVYSFVEIAVVALLAVMLLSLGFIAFRGRDTIRRQRLELEAAHARAESLARTDQLTALGNRLAFDEAVDREVARSRRGGSSLSVLLLDVDDFQAVNDSGGHASGDQILKAVSGVIAAQVRKPDLCFRWSGDEFVVLLPETSSPGAQELARRIRGIAAASLRRPDGRPLSLTAGIALLGDGRDGADLLAAAGRDLLRAKRATADPSPGGSP